MRIAFNPSTVAALIAPPNNKDITFDLRGQNIFARGVKFCGTDTNTWRDIKINNVSIDSNILDLRDGDNTTLTNINGVVTINSTWRPVVDNLTSDSTTSSLSAKQGKVLKSLIDGKSDSGHTHDDRYLKLTGGTMASNALITFADSGSWGTHKGPQGARGGFYWTGQSDYAKLYAEETAGDNLDLVIQFGDDNSNGLSIRNRANTQTSYISAGGVITTGTFKGNLDWSYITNKPSSYTPSAHTHAWNSLTHSSTTENQAILTNGKANGWKLYTLNISRWDNAANNAHSHSNKSVLDGITSALVNNWNTAYNFVSTITGEDTDKVINKWDEIVNFLAGITEDNKLNTLLNSKLSIQQLSAKDILTTKTNNALFWVNTKGNASTITTGPFTDHPYALLSVTNYNVKNSKFFYRSRLAFSSAGDIKVASCHHENEYKQDETWYNVLTSKNSGISGSTIKLNGTSITVYSSSTADGRYVKKSGDTMTGALNFANGTWNLVGDNVYIGDYNLGGRLCIKSANNDNISGIAIYNKAESAVANLWFDNANLNVDRQFVVQNHHLWIQGVGTAGGNNNRLTLVSGMPIGLEYNTAKRGTILYSNGIAFADPYNGNSNNDSGWIRHLETSANSGLLEIGVGNDAANEEIHFRWYNTNASKETIGYDVIVPRDNGTLALTKQLPSVGNGTIIINQAGSEKGRFTVNQSGSTTINLTDNNSTYNFSGAYFESGKNAVGEHDANNITYNSHTYYTKNGPSKNLGASTDDGSIYSQAQENNWVSQIAQDYRNGRLFVRGKNNNVWQDWKRIAQYEEIPTSLPANGGNSDTVDGIHANGLLTALSNSDNGISITVGGTTKSVSNINVNGANTILGISPQIAAATEYNSIYVSSPGYSTDQPVKMLCFDWYGNYWALSNIRSGSALSAGFGVFFKKTEIARFTSDGNLSCNASTATKLQTSRTIWGQSFDGTTNVSGSLSGVGHIQFSADNSYSIGTTTAEAAHTYTRQIWARHLNASRVYTGDTNLYIGYSNTAQVKFFSGTKQSGNGSNERMTILTNGNVGIGTAGPSYKLDVNGQVRASGFIHSGHSINDAVLLAGGGYERMFKLGTEKYYNNTSYELAFHKLSGLFNNLVWVDGSIWDSTSTSFYLSSSFYPYFYAYSSSMRTIYRMDGNNMITIDGNGKVVISCSSYPCRVGFFYTGRD